MFEDNVFRKNKDYPFVNILNPGDHDYPVGIFGIVVRQRRLMADYMGAQSPDEGLYPRIIRRWPFLSFQLRS